MFKKTESSILITFIHYHRAQFTTFFFHMESLLKFSHNYFRWLHIEAFLKRFKNICLPYINAIDFLIAISLSLFFLFLSSSAAFILCVILISFPLTLSLTYSLLHNAHNKYKSRLDENAIWKMLILTPVGMEVIRV